MAFDQPEQKLDGKQLAGIVVLVLFCGIPGAIAGGFMVDIELSLGVWLAISAIGGVVGGYLLCSKPAIAGILGGGIGGPGALFANYYWCQAMIDSGRYSVTNYELGLALLVGAAPGIIVGLLLRKMLLGRNAYADDTAGDTYADSDVDYDSADSDGD